MSWNRIFGSQAACQCLTNSRNPLGRAMICYDLVMLYQCWLRIYETHWNPEDPGGIWNLWINHWQEAGLNENGGMSVASTTTFVANICNVNARKFFSNLSLSESARASTSPGFVCSAYFHIQVQGNPHSMTLKKKALWTFQKRGWTLQVEDLQRSPWHFLHWEICTCHSSTSPPGFS